MNLTDKLQEIVDRLPENFYGTLTIGFQNSIPGTVEIKQSYRLENKSASRPTSRGEANVSNSRK